MDLAANAKTPPLQHPDSQLPPAGEVGESPNRVGVASRWNAASRAYARESLRARRKKSARNYVPMGRNHLSPAALRKSSNSNDSKSPIRSTVMPAGGQD